MSQEEADPIVSEGHPLEPGAERIFGTPGRGIWSNDGSQGEENPEAEILGEVLDEDGELYFKMSDPEGQIFYAPQVEVQIFTPPQEEVLPMEVGVEREFTTPKRGIWTSSGPVGQTNPEADIIGIVQHENGEVLLHMRDDEGEYYAPQSEVREATEEDQPLKPGSERIFNTPKRGIWTSNGPQGQDNPPAEILGEILHEDGEIYFKMSDPEGGQIYYAPKREVRLLDDASGMESAGGEEQTEATEAEENPTVQTEEARAFLGTENTPDGPDSVIDPNRPVTPDQPFHRFWEATKARFNKIESKRRRAAAKAGASTVAAVLGGISIPATAILRTGLSVENRRMSRYKEEVDKYDKELEEQEEERKKQEELRAKEDLRRIEGLKSQKELRRRNAVTKEANAPDGKE